ncbi:MAG: hypothetical protein HY369_04275 [Candidatus Aenigmarchaeota archaeon]|nr:hypothetical protein [Candidatus Aenigmarchaeota archaeon]
MMSVTYPFKTVHGVPPFDDYTLEHARKVIFRMQEGQLMVFVYLDGAWVASLCPGERPPRFDEIMLFAAEEDLATWYVAFKLVPSCWEGGKAPSFASVKVHKDTTLSGVLLAWARNDGEPRTVLKQVVNRFEGLLGIDLCSVCRDLEAEAQKIGDVLLCRWCAAERGCETGTTWPAQHHSLRGESQATKESRHG